MLHASADHGDTMRFRTSISLAAMCIALIAARGSAELAQIIGINPEAGIVIDALAPARRNIVVAQQMAACLRTGYGQSRGNPQETDEFCGCTIASLSAIVTLREMVSGQFDKPQRYVDLRLSRQSIVDGCARKARIAALEPWRLT